MDNIVLSGMRPTGKLHIGHLEGVVEEWIKLQETDKCNFFVADLHAITTTTDTSKLEEDTIDMVKDWIAYGIDPKKSTMFIQSQVKEHAELHLLFSMLVNLGRLERLPTFTDYMKNIIKVDQKEEKIYDQEKRAKVSYGFLGYPILQAADILLYNTTRVPVGEDQLPHIELTQEIARRFNHIYGQTFEIPDAKIGKSPRILGTDGKKMSKSYNNVISPTDDLETLKQKTKRMKSDPTRGAISNPGNPYNCSVYDLQEIYNQENATQIAKDCRNAKIGCKECKAELPNRMYTKYQPFNEKKATLTTSDVKEILQQGKIDATNQARETLQRTKEAMRMTY
jgi:tryptophanyl-tRNA synthetase